jgi:hypothetical protein
MIGDDGERVRKIAVVTIVVAMVGINLIGDYGRIVGDKKITYRILAPMAVIAIGTAINVDGKRMPTLFEAVAERGIDGAIKVFIVVVACLGKVILVNGIDAVSNTFIGV